MKTPWLVGLLAITVLAGCGGDDDAGSCGTVAGCGGNVVGDWTFEDVCFGGKYTNESCPTATYDSSGATITGTLAYKADGTYSATTVRGGTLKVTLPAACLRESASTAYCAEVAKNSEDPNYESVTCVPVGDACTCTYTEASTFVETGTYATAGNIVTRTRGGVAVQSSYCVKGNQLHETDPPVTSMGMETVSVVLKKK